MICFNHCSIFAKTITSLSTKSNLSRLKASHRDFVLAIS